MRQMRTPLLHSVLNSRARNSKYCYTEGDSTVARKRKRKFGLFIELRPLRPHFGRTWLWEMDRRSCVFVSRRRATNPNGRNATPAGSAGVARVEVRSYWATEVRTGFTTVTVAHPAVVTRDTRAGLAAIIVWTAATNTWNAR